MSQSVGSTFKEARHRLGLRVKDVAARTSARISASYLSCIENDLRLPSEELLLELADILGLDQRKTYMHLIRTKAPDFLREEFERPAEGADPRYDALKGLTLTEVVDRAAETEAARREVLRTRRELARIERGAKLPPAGFAERWALDASRYRMHIEKNIIEGALTLDGDVTLIRNVIGLEPRPGKPPIIAIQHTARQMGQPTPPSEDAFKVLEYPSDLAVEVEREGAGSDTATFRILFPDGLAFEEGKVRRVSYVLRSHLKGVYEMRPIASEVDAPSAHTDQHRDEKGERAVFVVYVDKPCEDLEVEVQFPRFYVPSEVRAWAGTQDFYESEDNFIDDGVAESWSLEVGDDYRARMRVHRPLVGLKFGIVWQPVFREDFEEYRRQLEGRETDE